MINLPDVKEAWLKQGAIPLVKTPEEFDAYLRKDIEKWAEGGQSLGREGSVAHDPEKTVSERSCAKMPNIDGQR